MGKKAVLFLLLCLALTLGAFAAGDPLVSLSHLTGGYQRDLEAEIDRRLDAAALPDASQDAGGGASSAASPFWKESRLKRADLLLGSTGDSVLLLAGSAEVTYPFGAVVDATSGAVVPSGASLAPNHRYLVAEDTAASFTVTSKTAVVDCQGGCTFAYSGEADYNAMASALKTLGLFRGSFTGYGQGFDLEVAPTRLQALIMFIRVLGEEEEALAWEGSTPFEDIQPGTQAAQYVGYAYERGYTNGYSATQFRPSAAVNAYQYTEFLLRAMGYSNADNTVLSDALLRARDADLLTPGEAAALEQGPFLRADLAYLSYYALDTLLADGRQTLAESLIERGAFSLRDWEDASAQVTGWRL